MGKELGFVIKAEKMLEELESELRDIYDGHEEIFSNEHEQMRELLKVIIKTKKMLQELVAD